jgi:hypothetical protein
VAITHDVAGICKLKKGLIPSEPVGTANHAETLRDNIHELVDLTEKAYSERNLPFEFCTQRLDRMDDFDICRGDAGRMQLIHNIANKIPQTPIITPLMANNGAESVRVFFTFLVNMMKIILNWIKPPQSGKTNDELRNVVQIATANYLETGIHTQPLMLLTSGKGLEKQFETEWAVIKGLFSTLDMVHQTNDRRINLDSYFSSWCHGTDGKPQQFWIRKSKSKKNLDFFLNTLANALREGRHIIICNDEADVGINDGGLITQWFNHIIPGYNKSLYDFLRERCPNFKIINYSATMQAYVNIDPALVHNIEPPLEDCYVHWKDVPRFEIADYAKRYCPLMPLLGDTCSSPHSPYGDGDYALKKFITHCLTEGRNGVRLRRARISVLEEKWDWDDEDVDILMEEPTVISQWHDFKQNTVPKIFSNLFVTRLVNRNDDKKRGMVIRYILKNSHIIKLTKAIRQIVSEDKLIIVPLCGAVDAFMDSDGNPVQHRFNGQSENAIREAYELRGIEYLSVPFVVFQTNIGRRGTQYSNHVIHIEFTKDPTTGVSTAQANGRAGGHKKTPVIGSELVVSELAEKIIIGERSKPYSHHTRGGGIGRPRSTEILTHAKSKGFPLLEEVFDWIEDGNILNRVWQLRAFMDNPDTMMMGGDALLPGNLPKVDDISNVINDDFFDFLEENHESIFRNGRGKPEYKEFKLLRLLPGSMNQPLGELRSKIGPNTEEKDFERYETMSINGSGNVFFPIGLRKFSGNSHTVNTNNRRRPYHQQIQIIYSYHKGWKRLICKGIALRFLRSPITHSNCQPKPGTHPFNLTTPEQQQEWT